MDKLKDTYNFCIINGAIIEKEQDLELIKSIFNIAKKGLNFINNVSLPKNSDLWTFVFREYYESLRSLIEAYLLFEGISAENHQCKNAYICFKHKELDLDWKFLESVRLKRNAINYRGELLNYKDWSNIKLNFELHINILLKEIERKI